MTTPFDTLRSILLDMGPSGHGGFEGLVALALSRISGLRFRLASSGYQQGLDGATEGADIAFEAKRYRNELPRADVLSKIPDFARNTRTEADRLWVLCATTEVGAQLTRDLEKDAEAKAIGALILDWPLDSLPTLASAIAAGGEDMAKAIHERTPSSDLNAIEIALGEIVSHPDHEANLARLRDNLGASLIATRNAACANQAWRNRIFASRDEAKHHLSQPMAPVGSALDRPALLSEARKVLESTSVVAIIGDEGLGKSWLAARLAADHPGLAIFLTADRFVGKTRRNLTDLLIEALIQQCDDPNTDAAGTRWRHRLSAWRSNPPEVPPMVVVDGINQRPDLPWHDLLDGLAHVLAKFGGRLIVTCRTAKLERIARDMENSIASIPIGGWSPTERDGLLRTADVDPSTLDGTTREILLNPRLLSIALEVLPHADSSTWQGLTKDRLLFEHIIRTRRDGFEPAALADVARNLSLIASRVFDGSTPPHLLFTDQADDVRQTRFFHSLPGPHGRYEIRPEGATLALGIALLDRIWMLKDEGSDVGNATVALLDPVEQLDRTAEVILAALTVCALDQDRRDDAIFDALLRAFGGVQNPTELMYPGLLEILCRQPTAVFVILEDMLLSRQPLANRDWFHAAALNLADREETRSVAYEAVRRWLSYYSTNGREQIEGMWGHDKDTKRHEDRVAQAEARISKKIAAMSDTEKTILSKMMKICGDIDTLGALALLILAGNALSGWVESLVQVNMAMELCHAPTRTRKAFFALALHNEADPVEAAEAFRESALPLQSEETGPAGRWTAVRLLCAAGDPDSAAEGKRIADVLLEDQERWSAAPATGWRDVDPTDRDAQPPADLPEVLERLRSIPENEVLQSMGRGEADYFLEEVTPVVARFAPDVLIETHRRVLASLATRTGFPLRQLVLNSKQLTPFMTPDIARSVIERFRTEDPFETFAGNERSACHAIVLQRMVAPLSGDEQLDAMLLPNQRGELDFDAMPYLRRPSGSRLQNHLDGALANGDKEALTSILQMALRTNAQICDEQVVQLCAYIASDNEFLQGSIMELGATRDYDRIRHTLVQSEWAANRKEGNKYVDWWATSLVLQAYKRREIDLADVLPRLPLDALPRLLDFDMEEAARAALNLFDAAVRCSIARGDKIEPPDADITLTPHPEVPYPLISTSKPEVSFRFPRGDFMPKDLSADNFHSQQLALQASVEEFQDRLFEEDLTMVMLLVDPQLIMRLAEADPGATDRWAKFFDTASDRSIALNRNLVLSIASALSASKPIAAASLFERSLRMEGVVRISVGSGHTLEHQALWGAAKSELIEEIWQRRLIQCATDHELAIETTAADRFGSAEFLDRFVEEGERSIVLHRRMRAATVAGFRYSDHTTESILTSNFVLHGPEAIAVRQAVRESRRSSVRAAFASSCGGSEDELLRLLTSFQYRSEVDSRSLGIADRFNEAGNRSVAINDVIRKCLRDREKERSKTLFGCQIEAPDIVRRSHR